MKRQLTDEEKALWQQVTRHDVPLYPRAEIASKMLSSPPLLAGEAGWGNLSSHAKISASFPPPAPPASGRGEKITVVTEPLTPTIAFANYNGIDRNTAERFRKGQLPFYARLDLHGYYVEKAHHALITFITMHHARGSRCLLVITGKGKNSSTSSSRGTLREQLPLWLAAPELRPMVLAFDTAQAKHGGSGATYVLLRRKRA